MSESIWACFFLASLRSSMNLVRRTALISIQLSRILHVSTFMQPTSRSRPRTFQHPRSLLLTSSQSMHTFTPNVDYSSAFGQARELGEENILQCVKKEGEKLIPERSGDCNKMPAPGYCYRKCLHILLHSPHQQCQLFPPPFGSSWEVLSRSLSIPFSARNPFCAPELPAFSSIRTMIVSFVCNCLAGFKSVP